MSIFIVFAYTSIKHFSFCVLKEQNTTSIIEATFLYARDFIILKREMVSIVLDAKVSISIDLKLHAVT